MKIGYAPEGWVDAGFFWGMHKRFCPDAELVEGHFRGSIAKSLRREYTKIFDELSFKGVDLVVILTDANEDDWRERKRNETRMVPSEFKHMTVLGIPDRNIECWICADTAWIAGKLERSQSDFEVDNPKGAFENAVGRGNRERVAELVCEAPIATWYARKESFEDFYDELRGVGKLRLLCEIDNLRDAE